MAPGSTSSGGTWESFYLEHSDQLSLHGPQVKLNVFLTTPTYDDLAQKCYSVAEVAMVKKCIRIKMARMGKKINEKVSDGYEDSHADQIRGGAGL